MKIKMYSADWCSDCRVAKRYLDDHAVDYEIIDIATDSQAAKYVMNVNGGKRIIPTFIINDIIYTNPGIQELSELVKQ
tara:strand:+ start:1104 stop:1337 length:234 start_codon:yes stop_codon:yes gene_type:complete